MHTSLLAHTVQSATTPKHTFLAASSPASVRLLTVDSWYLENRPFLVPEQLRSPTSTFVILWYPFRYASASVCVFHVGAVYIFHTRFSSSVYEGASGEQLTSHRRVVVESLRAYLKRKTTAAEWL